MTFAQLSEFYTEYLEYFEDDKSYYDKSFEFSEHLKDYLGNKEELRKLTKRQLVTFIAWCSTYRPLSLHQMIIELGNIY